MTPKSPVAGKNPEKAAPPPASRPVRRPERTPGVSAEQRSRLMERPLVRKAVELSGGSIVDVVNRIQAVKPVGAESVAEETPADPVEAGANETENGEAEAQ